MATIMADVFDPDCRQSNKVMNHMDPETAAIHARLRMWSIEVSRALVVMGYPGESSYHKWAALRIAPNPGHEAELSARSAHVDAAVARLGEVDRSVVDRYYRFYRSGDALWKKLPGIASKHEFDKVLRRARYRVSGFLMALE